MNRLVLALVVGLMSGWMLRDAVGSTYAVAAPNREYMAFRLGGGDDALQNSLTAQAAKGWRLHSYTAQGFVIYER